MPQMTKLNSVSDLLKIQQTCYLTLKPLQKVEDAQYFHHIRMRFRKRIKKKKDSNNTVKLKMLLFAREMQHSGLLPFYLIQKMETVTQTTCNLFQTSEVLKPGTSAAFGKFL